MTEPRAQHLRVGLTAPVATNDPVSTGQRVPFTSLCDYCNAIITRGQIAFRLPDGPLICSRCHTLSGGR